MSPPPWSYRIAVGTPEGGVLDWETTTDDPAPADFTTGPTPGLVLDGLTLVRKLPEGETWPCQPEHPVLTFHVAAAAAHTLSAQLVKGAPVAFRMGQLGPVEWELADWFTGYVTDVQLEARDGYTMATVTAIDWLVTLAEVSVDQETWPLEAAATRVGRIMAWVEQEAPEVANEWGYERAEDMPVLGDHVALATRPGDSRGALDLLLEILRCWVVRQAGIGDFTYARYGVSLQHDNDYIALRSGWSGRPDTFGTEMLAPDTWRLRLHTAHPGETPPPAYLGDLGGGVWGVLMDADPELGSAVAAENISLPVRWGQRIGDVPNVAIVVADFAGYDAGGGKYRVRWQLPQTVRKPRVKVKVDVPLEFGVADDATYLDGVSATYNLAFLLIPDTVNPGTSWGTDELTYRASGEDGYHRWPFVLGQLITVTDVDPDAHPGNTPWIHGLCDAYTVRVTDGFPVVDFTTRPQLRDSIHPDVLLLGDIPAGVTLAELDPTMTLHDTRLLRATP